MQAISTYSDALKAIWHRSGYDRGFISNPFAGDDVARLGLQRTQALLDSTGCADLPYKIVHVAGSKGKGSTCVMIDSILRSAGVRTGRHLSPHLHSFRERFIVDNEMIPQEDFVGLTRTFVTAAEEIELTAPQLGTITAFELTTAMALAWFSTIDVEVAVIEVGMGGTLDSTNVVSPSVSVITTLDFEHTAILGSTMAEIAGNKAGIIKQGRPAVSAKQPEEALQVIEQRAEEMGAHLLIAGRDWQVSGTDHGFSFRGLDQETNDLQSSLVGDHQVANAGLAIAAMLTLTETGPDVQVSDEAIRNGLASATLPGRFEQVELPSGQHIVIDGAHTAASAEALAKSIQDRFPDHTTALVIGMLEDKNPTAVLTPLLPVATSWIAVSPANPRSIPADVLQAEIESLGAQASMASTVTEGIEMANRSGSDVIVITGSLTTAAEARVALNLATVIDTR